MRETLSVLRGLQELDEDLYRVKDELRRLPEERSKRQKRIDEHRQRMGEFELRIRELRTRIKEIEDMTTGQRQRMRKLENEIAASTDAALIAAYQHELRSLRRDVGEAEEEGLGLVEQADSLNAERESLETTIGELEAQFAEYSTNVDTEIEAAERKRQGLDQERSGIMSGTVEPSILVQYEKLLDAREGKAMALLDGRVCQGCYVTVPNNVYVKLARAMELVTCPSCGRILYLPDHE